MKSFGCIGAFISPLAINVKRGYGHLGLIQYNILPV